MLVYTSIMIVTAKIHPAFGKFDDILFKCNGETKVEHIFNYLSKVTGQHVHLIHPFKKGVELGVHQTIAQAEITKDCDIDVFRFSPFGSGLGGSKLIRYKDEKCYDPDDYKFLNPHLY